MQNGIYIHKADNLMDKGNYIKIEYKETDKSITLTVIENTFRYLNGNLETLLKDRKVRINKAKSPHAINFAPEFDFFVIYPYRNGIPFLFERINEVRK